MKQGEVAVLVDTETSKENVTRAGASLGWQVKAVQRDGADYRLILEKSLGMDLSGIFWRRRPAPAAQAPHLAAVFWYLKTPAK